MVTIKDVAKRAGVAPSTVSRVIKNHHGISQETKARIREIMIDMDYKPNFSARNLVTNCSRTIGLIMKSERHDAYDNPFVTSVYTGVIESCRKEGYSIITTTANEEKALIDELKELIQTKQADGFILLFSKENNKIADYLASIKFPFVVVGKNIGHSNDAVYIDNDNELASYTLTRHLLSLGVRDIRLVNDDNSFAVAVDRTNGFYRAMEEAGLNPSDLTLEVGSSIDEIKSTLEDLFEHHKPEAIITQDGYFNAKVLAALYQLHKRIPEDVMTATFNDSPMTMFASPPQTTVNIMSSEIGREAGREIIEVIKNPKKMKYNITIPIEIIERESTGKE